jgi:hypothetical protein
MEEHELNHLLDLLFRFRQTFLHNLTTAERHALAKTILVSEMHLKDLRSKEVEVLSDEERPRW